MTDTDRSAHRTGAVAALGLALALAVALASSAAVSATMNLAVLDWHFSTPNADFADLPSVMPEIDYSPDNDLRSLGFVCQGEDFFLLVVAPGFDHGSATPARLILGDGGPGIDLALRDLYAVHDPAAPKLEWDATILYAGIAMEDLSEMTLLKSLSLQIDAKEWRLPLPGFAPAMTSLLEHCQ